MKLEQKPSKKELRSIHKDPKELGLLKILQANCLRFHYLKKGLFEKLKFQLANKENFLIPEAKLQKQPSENIIISPPPKKKRLSRNILKFKKVISTAELRYFFSKLLILRQ